MNTYRDCVKERRGDPVDTNPGMLRTGNATLADEQRHGWKRGQRGAYSEEKKEGGHR